MSYIIAPINNDYIKVPTLVFNQLGRLTSDKNDYLKVALYIISTNDFSVEGICKAVNVTRIKAEKSLEFWHGAGLLMGEADNAPVIDQRLPHLTTKEVYAASQANSDIQDLLQTAQETFGEVIGQSEANILVSLLVNDKMPVHYILLGLSHLAQQGIRPNKMKTIERTFLKWQELGIKDEKGLEKYFDLVAQREEYQKQVAEILHISQDSLTYTEKCKISEWFETFCYTEPIISHAALVAGEKASVAYINGILKKWHSKHYRTVRDVLASEGGQNTVTTTKHIKPENDFLSNRKGVVPKFN